MLSGFPTGGDEGIRRLAPNPRGSNPLVTKPKKNAQFLRIAASMKCEFKEETRIKKARFDFTIELLMLSGFPTGGDEGIRRLAPNPRGSNPAISKPKKERTILANCTFIFWWR